MSANPVNLKLTKEIRANIFPILRENGFDHFSGRKAWKHFDDKVYLFLASGVGAYFSTVTGYPSISITSSINIFYINFPDQRECGKYHKSGKPLPEETECHFRFDLEKIDPQEEYCMNIESPINRNRRDIWWVDPNGENIQNVVEDIAKVVHDCALKLVEKPCYQYSEQVRRYQIRK